jgi:flagellar protein FliT
MDPRLLTYYEAIERASADMLHAARAGNWDEVVKLEGACVLLISQLKHAAQEAEHAVRAGAEAGDMRADIASDIASHPSHIAEPRALDTAAGSLEAQDAARTKTRIMQRILINDAEIRQLAEPWLQNLDDALVGRRRVLH